MVETASQTSPVGAGVVLDRDECLSLLRSTSTGSIVIVSDEHSVTLPVSSVMDGDSVVFQLPDTWRTALLKEGVVTFHAEVDHEWTVTVQGHVDVIGGLPALQIPPGFEPSTTLVHDADPSIWVRVRPDVVTGWAGAAVVLQ